MKAFYLTQYGTTDNLQIKDIEKPKPHGDQVLVKIKATAINDYDWAMIIGKPAMYRLLFGLFKPRNPIPGIELSGVVEAVGPDATRFRIGEEVYGDISEHGFGTFAEYIAVSQDALVHKPEKMSHIEATAISHATMLAYQALFDVGRLQVNQKVLINGAGGGVGTFALQMAKLHNAEVTGVDTGEKLKMMEELGYDHIIDYKQEDFTKNGQQYDLIVDCKTNRSAFSYAKSLTEHGVYATVGGLLTKLFSILFFGSIISLFSKKRIRIVALRPNKDLNEIHDLYEKDQIKVIIDGPHPFEKIPELEKYFGEGKHSGKVVVEL